MRWIVAAVAAASLSLFACGAPAPAPKCAAVPAEGSLCGEGTRWNAGIQKCEPIPMEACKPGLAWNKTACMPCPDTTHWSAGRCVANSTLARADKGGPKWLANSGETPNMIFGGWDDDAGVDFYICRASHLKGTHPGRMNSATKQCHFSYGGKEITVPTYEVLTGLTEPVWEPISNGMPTNAFVAGEEPSGKLILCRVENGMKMLPGKVVNGMCAYALNGAEITSMNFEVAVFP